jgi:hypothetical protein
MGWTLFERILPGIVAVEHRTGFMIGGKELKNLLR